MAAPVAEPFTDYLTALPSPVDGWASDPHGVRLRAVLYVRRQALGDSSTPFEAAEQIAAAWLRGQAFPSSHGA